MPRITFTSGSEEDYYRNNARKKKKKNKPFFTVIFSILILTFIYAGADYFEIPYTQSLFFNGSQGKQIKIQKSSVIPAVDLKLILNEDEKQGELNNKQIDNINNLPPEIKKEETNTVAENTVIEVKEKTENKTAEIEKILFQKKQAVLFFSRNESYVKKGEGIFESAKEIKKKMKMDGAEFITAWYSSKFLIHGKEMSIEEIGLVPKKTKIIYDANYKIFKIVVPKGGKIGTYRDLYSIYLSKRKRAPKWLLAKIGMGSDIAARELSVAKKKKAGLRGGNKESDEYIEQLIKNPIFPPVSPRISEEQEEEEKPDKPKIKTENIIFKQLVIIKI